ncbi:MAG: hypothetical protein RLZZ182_734 [Pseudomonadota bacterium]
MSYTITLKPSGHSYICDSGTPVLKAGLDAGLFLPYSCRSGVCKTCRGRVTQGQVDFGGVHPKYLNEEDKAKGYALLCCAKPLSDLVLEVDEIDADSALPSKYMPVRVLEVKRAAPDVMIVKLGLPMNEPTLFRAGQYVEFVLADGLRRSYSIANVPSNDGVRQLELHVRHMPRGLFTDHVFGQMKVRDVHRVEFPLGSFFLRENSQRPMVMLASGTGFAPIKSIIEHSILRGMRRPITLYWGGRKREDLYMMDLAQSWADQHAHILFVPVLSEPTAACHWTGRQGFVHRAVMEDLADLSSFDVYACGSPIVVESARRDFVAERGLDASNFYADAFLTAADKALTC